jgi:hypothetical protein
MRRIKPLEPQDRFDKSHWIVGGDKDPTGVWIPNHAPEDRAYLYSPSLIIPDAAFKEFLKAIYKHMDTHHLFLITRLYSFLWLCMFYKLSDYIGVD